MGSNSADYEGVMLYTAESSMSAQEILLVKTKTTEQAEEVKAAVEQRRANRRNDFDGYAPKQVQLLDSAQLKVRGDYIFLAVAPKADELSRSIFEESVRWREKHMLFSSITFLFIFLPLTLLLYYLVPFRMKNYVMLAASLIFYAWGEPVYIILMILSIILNYFFFNFF